MDSIGAILKGAREEKKLPLNQVSSDTHILPGYILAIEENRFQDLPGEAYCAGFIGTLARYYGLDSGSLVAMFRGVPEKEISAPKPKPKAPVVKTEKKNKVPVILIIVILIIMGAAIWFILSGNKSQEVVAPEPIAQQEEPKANVYVMNEVLFERSFAENDIVQVQLGESSSEIACRTIGSSVLLGIRSGNVLLTPSQEKLLDLNGDSRNDVKVTLKEVNPEAKTAIIRIDRALEAPVPPPLPAISIAAKPESIIMHDKGSVTVLASPVKRNFIMEVNFSGPCMFRYQADSNKSTEKYYKAEDQVRLEVADQVRVWLSNAGHAKILIGDAEITLGNKGDITSEKIGWEEAGDKSFNLSIVAMH